MPVPHLSSEKIIKALRASHGVMSDAAKRLGIARCTLYERCYADAAVEAVRTEEREVFVDFAELELVKLVKAGNATAVIYALRTVGAKRGWREGVVVEQEPAPRRRVDMSAALRALSPDELMALEGIVAKLEANAKASARDLEAGYDDGSRRSDHRGSRRGHLRGEVSASDDVGEVEAVGATGEVDQTAKADGAVLSRDETEPGDLT